MEHILGETLGHRLERKPPTLSESISWGRQIADALQMAHANGVTHRDLKPANVMISDGGSLKVLDFGLAVVGVDAGRGTSSSSGLPAPETKGGTTPAGSPGYISPEQLRGGKATAAADVWGWGCVLFECLTGTEAFPGETPLERVTNTLERRLDASRFPAEVPEKLAELVLSCLSPDPKDRPSSIDELQERLREVSRRSSDRPSSRVRTYSVGLVLALLVAVVFLSWRAAEDERARGGASSSGTSSASSTSPRRVTFSGFVWGFDLAGSGDRVACVTNPGDIVVVDLGTDAERVLRNDPTLQAVSWSPDGTELLAYSLGKEKDGSFLLSTSTGEMRPVGPPNFQGRCWSPDGTRILGPISKTHVAQGPVYLYDVASDSVTAVPLPDDLAHVEYDWSARNGWILVLGTRPGESRGAWMVPESGGEAIQVGGADTDRARWAPDGQHLLVVDRPSDRTVLSALTLSPQLLAGEVDRLVSPGTRISHSTRVLELPTTTTGFRVARDGRTIALLGQIPQSTLWRLVRRPDGSGFDSTPIWGGTVLAGGPKIRPGGEEVAFLAGPLETTKILRLPLAGGEPVSMTDVGLGKAFLAWSPDGTELAFGADDEGREQLRIASTIDGSDRPVPGAEGRAYLEWLEADRILYHSLQDDNLNFRVVSPSGNDQRPLFDPPREGTLFQVAASHSGDWLAVAGARGGRTEIDVWLVSLDSPDDRLLFDGTAVPITWSEDDEWVYLVRETRESRFVGESVGEVLRVRVSDGTVEPVVALPPGDLRRWTDVDISPDGRTVVCALSQDQKDVWIADIPRGVLAP
ncbi:MAG: protein kinase [Candidatus Eisenbacteria bacterium]